MRTVRTMIATCLFLGLAGGAALAGGGSGSAAPAAPAAPAAGAPKTPAAPAAGAPKTPAAAPPEMAMPKPPQEVADMAKAMGGTWKCTGKVNAPSGSMDVTANVSGKLDVDKMWIHESLVQTKAKAPYKFEAYMTFDAAAKKWNRVMVDNMGVWEQTSADAPDAAGTTTWTGQSGGMGMSSKVKTTHTKVGDKEFKLEGTMSMDGKTWNPTFQMDCKK